MKRTFITAGRRLVEKADLHTVIKTRSYSLAEVSGGTTIQDPGSDDALIKIVKDPLFYYQDCGQGMSRQDILSPNYVIFWHEIGHAYYNGGVVRYSDQACKAVDLENMVRALNKLALRNNIYAQHF